MREDQSRKPVCRDEKAARKLCSAADRCGACSYLGVPYSRQLKEKTQSVKSLVGSFGPVRDCIGCDEPYGYRNKVHAVMGLSRDGQIVSGTYQEGTHKLVPVEKCLIENEKADEIIRDIRTLCRSFKYTVYQEDKGRGLLRHVLIRTAHRTNQIMVVLVTSSLILPSKNNFVKALRKLHPEITTIVQNVNSADTSMVLGEREIVLYGKGSIEDQLGDCVFRISSKSFYQINSPQTEKLYAKAMELAGVSAADRVLDAYCGIGTIALYAAGKAGEVIGVEQNPDAVRDAVYNAKRNQIRNARFFRGDAGEFLEKMADEGEKLDVLFMDPPRCGSTRQFLDSVCRIRPERVVYISCNPATLADDLKRLTGGGYRVREIWPVDMFPQTDNTECVCLLHASKKAIRIL